MCFTLTKKVRVKIQILLRNYSTCNVYFSYRFIVVLPYDFHHTRHIHFPPLISFLNQTGIRTELTVVHTDVGRFDMKVSIEISISAVLFLTDIIWQATQITHSAAFITHDAPVKTYPLPCEHFLSKRF